MQIETEVRGVDISITKARPEGVAFAMKENGLPSVAITLGLYSVGGNKVTAITLSTDAWNENAKFGATDIPVEIYEHIAHIVNTLLPVSVRKINSIDKLLQ